MTTMDAFASDMWSGVVELPLYFSTERGFLFGWLHRPAGDSKSDVGVVICKPFGYEAICGHRSLRTFARAIAGSGAPTLVFDYLGTGDSDDLDQDADQIENWCQDVGAAVAMLRRATGAQRVCLLGFRLGASLAAMAANRTKVDALILVAPVMKGSAYLRQLRTAEALMGRIVAAPQRGSNNEAMEINGHYLSSASVRRLSELELCELPLRSSAAAVIVDHAGGLPAIRAWASSRTAPGVQADCIVQPGLVQMMMVMPENTQPPWALISDVQSWLLRFMSSSRAEPQLETTPTTSFAPASLEVATEAGLMLTEQPVHFGQDARLFGIVSEPRTSSGPPRGVVLVNSGAHSHVGVGRLNVELARHWAQAGCVTLRMDLAGLGDSKTLPGRRENEMYPPTAVDDIRTAVDYLRERYRVTEVSVGGICSGAYHAFTAAAAGVGVNRLLLVNPEAFLWQEGQIYSADVVRVSGALRKHAFSTSGWKRLFTGQIDLVRQTKLLSQRLSWSLTARAQRLMRILHIPLPNDLGRILEALTARGVEIILVFSPGEPGLKQLELQAAATVRNLSEHGRLNVVDGADHGIVLSAARAALRRLLSQSLALPPEIPDLKRHRVVGAGARGREGPAHEDRVADRASEVAEKRLPERAH